MNIYQLVLPITLLLVVLFCVIKKRKGVSSLTLLLALTSYGIYSAIALAVFWHIMPLPSGVQNDILSIFSFFLFFVFFFSFVDMGTIFLLSHFAKNRVLLKGPAAVELLAVQSKVVILTCLTDSIGYSFLSVGALVFLNSGAFSAKWFIPGLLFSLVSQGSRLYLAWHIGDVDEARRDLATSSNGV